MRIEAWSRTDVGKKRDHNEDYHLCNSDLNLFMVADGMGGHQAGDAASRLAVETVEKVVKEQLSLLEEQPSGGGTQVMFVASHPVMNLLSNSVVAASQAILDKVEEDPDLSGMGTTTVLLFFHEDKAYFAHVGDSRLYRIRGDRIVQLTTDHSLVQEQIATGIITEEEASQSTLKNIITRSVGAERNIKVDTSPVDFRAGDLFLLCSDGLTGLVEDKEILGILNQKTPETALDFFINLANSRGGTDNITVIVVRVTDDSDDVVPVSDDSDENPG